MNAARFLLLLVVAALAHFPVKGAALVPRIGCPRPEVAAVLNRAYADFNTPSSPPSPLLCAGDCRMIRQVMPRRASGAHADAPSAGKCSARWMYSSALPERTSSPVTRSSGQPAIASSLPLSQLA